MKLSLFEIMVIEALFKNDPEELNLRGQLIGASVIKREYTGVGLYTDIEIENKSIRISETNRYIEKVPKVHLVHPKLKAGAGAILWFENGYISKLECYAYEGNWPGDEAKFKINVQQVI